MNIDWNLALTIAVGVVLGGLVFQLLMAVIADLSLLTPLLVLAALVGIVWGGYYVFTSDAQWAKDARWFALIVGALLAAIIAFVVGGIYADKLREKWWSEGITGETKPPSQH
ncbi:MAG: hypothetical protein QG602_1380 [Verrucomicrobiota bacterium]|nr:hypothetical protein [Verrucomicrobiota bacterium]